jgi:hypothetical protein
MSIQLRIVKPKDIILPEDHNNLVDAFKQLVEDFKEIIDAI